MVDKYTVWVGGIEINDTFMPKEEAVELANIYRKQGYDDVHVERYHSIPTTDKIKNNKKSENMTAVNVPTVAYITDDNRLSVSLIP